MQATENSSEILIEDADKKAQDTKQGSGMNQNAVSAYRIWEVRYSAHKK